MVESPEVGLLVTGDLIFSTKITGTARALGLEVAVVASPAAAQERLAGGSVRFVLLDLGLFTLTAESIQQIVSAAGAVPVMAYGSHVDTDRLESARAAGCREVMPRSRLAAELPQLLREYFGE